MLTIANHVVILGVPDYGTAPEYGYIYGTDVTSGELGTGYGETRNIRRAGKRRKQAWTIKTSTGYETFSIEESIRSALESKKAAVPWLPHVRQVLAVDGNTLTLNSAPYGMASGTRLWYVDMDTRRGGYLISGGATGATLTVTDGTGVTARCLIAPLMFGILDSATVSIRTVSGNTYELEFRESASGGAAPAIVSGLTFSGWDADSPRLFAFVTGREPMTYAWTRDDEAVPSGTSDLIMTPGDVNGTYKLVASNDFGSAESDEYTFAGYPPVITTQPVNRYIAPGAGTTLTCVASTDEERDGPVSYACFTAAGVQVGTSGTLTLTSLPEDYSVQYYFVASNSIGSTTSNTVTVATGYGVPETGLLLNYRADEGITEVDDKVSSWAPRAGSLSYPLANDDATYMPTVATGHALNGIYPVYIHGTRLLNAYSDFVVDDCRNFSFSVLVKNTGTGASDLWGVNHYTGAATSISLKIDPSTYPSTNFWKLKSHNSSGSAHEDVTLLPSADSVVRLLTVVVTNEVPVLYDGTTKLTNDLLTNWNINYSENNEASFYLGGSASSNRRTYYCYVYEACVWGRSLSSSELQQLVDYANHKYGLSLS